MSASTERHSIGVVLLNMGGPERLADVEPFLVNLFSDREIIRLSPFAFLQKPLARLIARRRAPKSCAAYELIGGGSPQGRLTAGQAKALATALADEGDFRVVTAMRYWHPSAADALEALAAAGVRRCVALTLYPHYSKATTGSSLADLRRAAAAMASPPEIVAIDQWPEQPDYVACLADDIAEGLGRFADPDSVQLVYSAHSLPVRFIEEGDPYLEHLHRTIGAVETITGVSGELCFQSRSGPVRWLTPSTPEMLERLAGEGCRQVLVVPLSFVSDHVETLYEIDIQYRELAEGLGLRLERVPGLNDRPRFIRGLRSLVLEACSRHRWLP